MIKPFDHCGAGGRGHMSKSGIPATEHSFMRTPASAKIIKYEVRFTTSERGLSETKVIPVDVNDTGIDGLNNADAIIAASLVLDDQGIKHWSLKSCAKVTS
jgi:hypothetical protein